ncbi:hypothetical protein KAK07_22700 [Ideonella sp. 4Y16]|uniref:Uncharacterized protein n=1 Tax=Ideonella aquatica TaxID=2824119 RepID=A0A940YKM8_9BURK|nr:MULTISPECIES: hypothetical protein [Ideonella]MBQ0946169.1 hypothetical protein [Ideonella alba]MBQ0960407.1 hypothetical protein [Ideonella aquatica]
MSPNHLSLSHASPEGAEWHVFADKCEEHGSLWFGFQLALTLTRRGQRVRLFTNGLDELARAFGTSATTGVQVFHGVELVDARLDRFFQPARNSVQMFYTRPSKDYLSRFARSIGGANSLQVVPLDSGITTSNAIIVLDQRDEITSWMMQMGDLPRRGGYIRLDGCEKPTPGSEDRARTEHRAVAWRWFELPPELIGDPSGMVVTIAVGSQGAASRALDMVAKRPAPQPTACMLRGKSIHAPAVGEHGSMGVVEFPEMSWSTRQDLVLGSDLLITDKPELAAQANQCGIPVIWSADHSSDMPYLDWYTVGCHAPMRAALCQAFLAVGGRRDIDDAAQQYWAHFKDAQRLAQGVAERIARAPELADVALAALNEKPEAVSVVEHQFSPTAPIDL